MPSDQTKSASLALRAAVGDQLVTVLTNEGYSDADERVYANAPPSGVADPHVVYQTREQPSVVAGNKTDDPVRGVAEIHVRGGDDVAVAKLAKAVQNYLVDAANDPSVSGFRVFWHDLVFNEPVNEIREDAENRYSRVMEIEYQLDPT